MSLQEYILEHETRFDEAESRGGLVLNDTGKCHMFLKYSGLEEKRIEDINLKVSGDLSRYQEVKNLLHLRGQPARGHHRRVRGGTVPDKEQPPSRRL